MPPKGLLLCQRFRTSRERRAPGGTLGGVRNFSGLGKKPQALSASHVALCAGLPLRRAVRASFSGRQTGRIVTRDLAGSLVGRCLRRSSCSSVLDSSSLGDDSRSAASQSSTSQPASGR